MTESELHRRLDDLESRLAYLESRHDPRVGPGGDASPTDALPTSAVPAEAPEMGHASVTYTGSGEWNGAPLAWRMEHSWDAVRTLAGDSAARVLGALSSGLRLRIVAALLERPCTTAELVERLEQPSSGQLFHHLRELLAAGVVHQPVRGTYAVRRQDVVPLLALLAAAIDVGGPDGTGEPQ